MPTKDMPLMDAAIKKMHWHEQRQKVLAQNISNADTAGYKPQDIAPMDFKSLLESSSSKSAISAGSVATTKPNHIGAGSTSGSSTQASAKNQKNPYEASPAGNSVVLEEQLLKMNENFTDHRLTTTIYQKNVDMLKTAIRSQ